jgi:hypothetical protein
MTRYLTFFFYIRLYSFAGIPTRESVYILEYWFLVVRKENRTEIKLLLKTAI